MTSILVVDDDPLVCEMVTDCFRQEMDARVDCALSGREAALLIKSCQFDLALIDAVVPGIGGFDLAELAANENIPVLLTSGHPAFCEKFDRFNFPHLQKPWDLDILVEEAAGIIRNTRENVRRVRAAARDMRRHREALEAAMTEAHRLVAAMSAEDAKPGKA